MDGTRWLAAGLLLTTLATLQLELLDSRLLSVLTWYHLSFLAVSLAMLGGAAGAVAVFLAGDRLTGDAARRRIGPLTLLLACTIPLAHFSLMQLRVPPLEKFDLAEIAPLAAATGLLTLPFALSGAVVTLALTRCGGRIGHLYASDLIGAALGCLLVIPVLHVLDMFSAGLLTAGLAALAAAAYQRFSGNSRPVLALCLATALFAAAAGHSLAGAPIGVAYPRGKPVARLDLEAARWNTYSLITVARPRQTKPFYWGRGATSADLRVELSLLLIDGGAGTPLTRWDGRRESLDWAQYDVTALPYHLRAGDAAVIGVGGGRDILSAIWAGSRSVVGIELNAIFVDILERTHRSFSPILDHPGVRVVNDEARSWLSRHDQRYDVLQMSLVDTWAATGAGAFTLTENALYTVEAWRVFLSRVKPDGFFSTSRWFSPQNVSETSRLLALCVETLLELGTDEPRRHIALVSRGKVATLLVSPTPIAEADLRAIREVAQRLQFSLLVMPDRPPDDPLLAAIVASTSLDELARATEDPHYDYSAPRDARPYFFNMLKPGSLDVISTLPSGDVIFGSGGVLWGNIRATATLALLLAIALGLTALIVFVPLLFAGLPQMSGRLFATSLSYFALIGYGFMSIQIPLLQRFSVFLGHPIHTYSIILFAMILFAGIGSYLSERLDARGRWRMVIPFAIAAGVLLLRAGIPPITEAAIVQPLPIRAAIVVLCVAPLSLLLGFCFPLGLRLVQAISPRATAWMWGVNGACGVLASIIAVAVSIWAGIGTNLLIAAVVYILLALPARTLARA